MKNLLTILDKGNFINSLPIEDNPNPLPRHVYNNCGSYVNPTKVASPTLITYSNKLAKDFGIKITEEEINILSGNLVPEEIKPIATCYGGHQFGVWADQLGDGRAILLGELTDLNNKKWEIQLKGAGTTPYSRNADGRAVLRSSIREFLASEAMFHLGIPTTRALCLIDTGEKVARDMFYNGDIRYETGAILTRVAKSFIRFGNFEILASRNDILLLKKLADFCIKNYFPDIKKDDYLSWFKKVSMATLDTIVGWYRVGFVHGVMNTDNLSILGDTIDYGPYGWLDNYDPSWTPNTSDFPNKRYCFANQATIGLWNLKCLAIALSSLINSEEEVISFIDKLPEQINNKYQNMVANKLGLRDLGNERRNLLASDLFKLLSKYQGDMTIFFRLLSNISANSEISADTMQKLQDSFYTIETKERVNEITNWLKGYQQELIIDGMADSVRQQTMNQNNPKYILRNYQAYQAIESAEKKDYSILNELQQLLTDPYSEQPLAEKWNQKRPEWAENKSGCTTLSCSS
jgi:serine/tyrosine/threonine adenylyltransferase